MLPINKSHTKSLYVILIVILITSCTQDDTPINDSLFGKWQLVEIYDGALSGSHSVDNGYIITYRVDSTLTSTYPTLGCNVDHIEGSFKTTQGEKGRELTLFLSCEDKELITTYYYGVDSKGFIVISPKESSCDEGCYWKFKRIEAPKTKD